MAGPAVFSPQQGCTSVLAASYNIAPPRRPIAELEYAVTILLLNESVCSKQ
jgi:hypothetical protein